MIFEGLKISGERDLCDAYMGEFPVISISLKDVAGSDYEQAVRQLRYVVRDEVVRISDKLDKRKMGAQDIKMLMLISDMKEEVDVSRSLKIMSDILYALLSEKGDNSDR